MVDDVVDRGLPGAVIMALFVSGASGMDKPDRIHAERAVSARPDRRMAEQIGRRCDGPETRQRVTSISSAMGIVRAPLLCLHDGDSDAM